MKWEDDVMEAIRAAVISSPKPVRSEEVARSLGQPEREVHEVLMRCGRNWGMRVRDGCWDARPADEDPERRLPPWQ